MRLGVVLCSCSRGGMGFCQLVASGVLMIGSMPTPLRDTLDLVCDRFACVFRRTTPDPERSFVPLATNDEANRPIRDTELLFNPIRDTSIGK